jgi:[ribosomal protein S18]-alanine N-acetyltransferase
MAIALQPLTLQVLDTDWLSAVVAFDGLVFGGFWSEASYQGELIRSSGLCLGLTPDHSAGQRISPLLAFGCVWHILDELHVIALGVHPDYRRQSLGRLVLLSFMRHARARGLEHATLEVRASNQGAIALYEGVGFVSVGHRRKYYSDTGEDAVLMWCNQLQSDLYLQHLNSLWLQTTQQLTQNGWHLTQIPVCPTGAQSCNP